MAEKYIFVDSIQEQTPIYEMSEEEFKRIQEANEKVSQHEVEDEGSVYIAIGNARKSLDSSSATLSERVEVYEELYSLINK